MRQINTYAQALARAAEIAGGVEPLAEKLEVGALMLRDQRHSGSTRACLP